MKKTSSRQGRFKKQLITLDLLEKEAPFIEEQLLPFLELHKKSIISDPELCSIYILIVLNHRRPFHFLGQRGKPLFKNHKLHFPCHKLPLHAFVLNKIGNLSVGDVFNFFSLRATPQAVNRALLEWSNDQYKLELSFKIPSPHEVLHQQSYGRRCVSLIYKKNWASKLILGERDSLSFLFHDLIHADHFYFQNNCFNDQLSFYGFLSDQYSFFTDLMNHPKFFKEFEYLISDMNAYPIHSLKCLKSAIIFHGNQSLFDLWIRPFKIKHELGLLNTGAYHPETQDRIILDWLHDFKKI